MVIAGAAALLASVGWATGIVVAESPARQLGVVRFTHVQLVACAGVAVVVCTAFSLWASIDQSYGASLTLSAIIGIIFGNLAMFACLRLGGPRRTELMLSLKAPCVGVMAFLWFAELPEPQHLLAAGLVLAGVVLAIAPDRGDHKDSAPYWQIFTLGLTAALCQGFGFLVVRPALMAGAAPLAVTAARLTIAAVMVTLTLRVFSQRTRAEPPMTPGLLAQVATPGILGYVVSSSLLLFAFAHLDAAIATVLGSLSPILVLPLVWLKTGHAPGLRSLVGATVSLSGVFGLALF